MQKNNLEEIHYKELLREQVELKFGKQVKYSKDCRLLSQEVYEATGRQLSVSTIKRLFGLILSPFNPSRYTLDSFAGYLGLGNWESFTKANKFVEPEIVGEDNLELPSECFHLITETSCVSLSRKSGYDPDTFIYRTFAETHFEEFMQSGKTATMLIAPTGYGKSAVLLQWMNTYFWGKDNRFRDDNVCLVDGGIFFTFYNQAQQNELLAQLFDFDFKTIHKLYLRQKTTINKIRYFLIIDDVDKIFSVREKYYLLAENILRLIMLYKDNPWFKMILTCRPENLDTFTSLINNNPILAEAFFKVSFIHKNHFDSINVPLFDSEEIKAALSSININLSYYYLSLYHPDVFNIINHPSFFSFLLRDENSSEEKFSEIGFLNHLIQFFYYSHPFAEEKQQLIKKFLQLCILDDDFTLVKKDLLLDETEFKLAYQELLKAGLLYEYFESSDSPGVQLKVKFSNSNIFEYSLARALLGEKGEGSTLLHAVFVKYRDAFSLQYALLKWFIKIAFFEGNTTFLRQVHQLIDRQVNISNELNNESMPGTLRSIHAAFIEGLRTYKIPGESLMPFFAKSKLGQRLYFEDYFDMDNLMFFPEHSLELYTQNSKTADGEMIVRFIHFIKAFYLGDYKKCSLVFEEISQIDYTDLNSSLCLGYYFSSWFLFASLKNYQNREDMVKMFLSNSTALRTKGSQALRFNPGFEYFVIYSLNTGNFFDEIRFVTEYLFDTNNFNQNMTSCFDQYLKLCYARSLLHTGEQEHALELFRQVTFKDFPSHIKHYMKLHVNLAKYDFLKFQKSTIEALDLLAETRSLANKMGYSYFIQKTKEMEVKLLKERKDIPK